MSFCPSVCFTASNVGRSTTSAEKLKLHGNLAVDLATCEVVGDGPLAVGDVGYPVVAVDVTDAKEIQAVEADP